MNFYNNLHFLHYFIHFFHLPAQSATNWFFQIPITAKIAQKILPIFTTREGFLLLRTTIFETVLQPELSLLEGRLTKQ